MFPTRFIHKYSQASGQGFNAGFRLKYAKEENQQTDERMYFADSNEDEDYNILI